MRPALVRTVELLLLGALPVLATAMALIAYAGDNRLALDFHHELYRQAELVAEGADPYEAPDADLTDRANAVWPMAAVLPIVPLTAISPGLADWLATAFVFAALAAALWLLGIRDWRIFGVTLLWPSVIEGYQTANASLVLCLFIALMLRYRGHPGVAGVSLGAAIAVKFFLWPLVPWLVGVGRARVAAIAAGVAAASLLLVLPFTNLVDYARLLRNLSETFDQDAYTSFALLLDLGAPSSVARGLTLAAGVAVLAVAWRRGSLGLAIAAALVLSPIVWRHFFSLLVVPLALSRPRFDAVWLIPIGLWVGDGTFNGAPWQTASVLGLVATTFVLCETRLPGELEPEHRALPPHLERA